MIEARKLKEPSRICVVAVRGGSKGVPGKNWRKINGLPLFAHSVVQAVESGMFDAVVVTSDHSEILESALGFGASAVVRRPKALATDSAGKVAAIVHAVQTVEAQIGSRFDTVVDLDATAPLRTLTDIAEAVSLLEENGVESVLSGSRSRKSAFFNQVMLDQDSGRLRLVAQSGDTVYSRQAAPTSYDLNGSVYVWAREALQGSVSIIFPSTLIYEMPEERSFDIDSELDFEIVKLLMER